MKTYAPRILVVFALIWAAWNWPIIASMGRAYSNVVVQTSSLSSPAEASQLTDNYVEYPRLGIKANMGSVVASKPTNVADWPAIQKQLRQGVSLTFSTDEFDKAPRAFLTGHSSDVFPHPYAAIFAPLTMAKAGDTFSMVYHGKQYNYRVIHIDRVAPTDTVYFNQVHTAGISKDKQELDLVTCWPIFTAQKRLVVAAERLP